MSNYASSLARGGKGVQCKTRNIARTNTSGTLVATLPYGSRILGFVLSGVASNAGTTATVSIGSTAANANEYVNGQSVLAGGAGNGVTVLNGVAGAVGAFTYQPYQNVPIFVKYAETGTASSAGAWKLHILYTTGNDLYDDSGDRG